MKLRGASPLHTVHAIKNGLVGKVPNLGHDGRPALKLKKLQDIYKLERHTGFSSPAVRAEPRNAGLPFDSDPVEVKIECLPRVDQKTTEGDQQAYLSDGSDGGHSNVPESHDTTLRQLKKLCKLRKRKLSKFLNPKKESVGTSSCAKPKQLKDDGVDLHVPLIQLKPKFAKNSKRKKNCLDMNTYKTSQRLLAIADVDRDLNIGSCQLHNELLSANDGTKIEVLSPNDPNSSNMISPDADCFVHCDGLVDSMLVLGEKDLVLESEDLVSSREEEQQNCIATEGSFDYTDQEELNSCSGKGVKDRETENGGNLDTTTQSLCFPENEQKEQCIIKEVSFDAVNESRLGSNGFNHEDVQCANDIKDYNALPVDLEIDTTGFLISNICSPQDLHPHSSSSSCLLSSVEDNSPQIAGKQSPTSINGVAPTSCSSGIQCFDGDNKLTASPVTSGHCHFTVQGSPESLLSTRKSISPASRERLSQAMKWVALNDVEKDCKSRVRLEFRETTGNEASSVEPSTQIAEDCSVGPNEGIVRSEITVKSRHHKGACKGAHRSHAPPPLTGRSSIESCSKSAIAFSQRQLHDIESLAAKLTKQVKSMKDILEKKLHPEACPDMSCSVDEVRLAITKATKAEESARKWMSIMARDCTRFCKIMKVAERDSVGCRNGVVRERKKITFADEVGRMLCDIKTFVGEKAAPTGMEVSD